MTTIPMKSYIRLAQANVRLARGYVRYLEAVHRKVHPGCKARSRKELDR